MLVVSRSRSRRDKLSVSGVGGDGGGGGNDGDDSIDNMKGDVFIISLLFSGTLVGVGVLSLVGCTGDAIILLKVLRNTLLSCVTIGLIAENAPPRRNGVIVVVIGRGGEDSLLTPFAPPRPSGLSLALDSEFISIFFL